MKENNKLLADFLKLETTEHNGNLFLTQDGMLDLQYDEIWNPLLDWNQLMQVIGKIKNLDFCDSFTIEIDDFCMICCKQRHFEKHCDNKVNTTQATYDCCIDFVNWYNLKINGTNFN